MMDDKTAIAQLHAIMESGYWSDRPALQHAIQAIEALERVKAAAPTYDPAKVRELLAVTEEVCDADRSGELTDKLIAALDGAAQALRDGEGE